MSLTPEQEKAVYTENNNIIVSAGAGSGKTKVLTERVLRKLNDGVSIDNLLILTFTNNAAAEMAKRIRDNIKGKPGLREELNKLDSSYITTFDSFALSLVKKYHNLVNVKKNVNIIESNVLSLKIKELLDEIMDEEYIKKELNFVKLISDFCIKDDNRIKETIIKFLHKLDMKYDKDDYLNNYLDNFYSPDFINYNINLYLDIIKNKVRIIDNLLTEISKDVDTEFFMNLNECLSPLLNSNTYEEIRNNIPEKLPNLPRGQSDFVQNTKGKIKDLLDDIKDYTKYENEQEIFDTIMLTKDYVSEFIILIKELDNRINKYKQENDLYDFIDISKLAIKIVEENENIKEELKNNFNEIMIDEYQDTNDLQEYFISLISKGNNVYMVGDVKQSIYRFRNANPDLFSYKYNNYKVNNGGIKIDLLNNFRSRREVLDNVNLIFDYIMDNYIGGANYIESHRMIAGNKSYDNEGKTNQNNNMEIYTYPYDSKGKYTKSEIEAFIIAHDIKEKVKNKYQIFDKDNKILRDATYNDFCILIDRGTDFDLYKRIFLYNQIPLNINRDEDLTNCDLLSVIKNIYSLLDVIINNKTKDEFIYSYMSIGRSFLMDYDDSYIFSVIKNNKFEETELYKKIINITNNINSKTLSMILDDIINEFDIYNKLYLIGDIDDNIVKIDYLYSLCETLNSMGYTYLDFVSFLNDIFDNDSDIKFSLSKEDNTSVKIMTIHKSKGLEYYVCYFPGLSSKFNDDDLKDKYIFDNKLGIITPYFLEGIDNTIYRELFKQNFKLDDISEQIRKFYVAFTRVKEKIIMVMPEKEASEEYNDNGMVTDDKRLSYKSFSELLYSIYSKIKDYEKKIDLNTLNLSKDYNLYKRGNVFDKINDTNEVIKTINIDIPPLEELIESHYSKSTLTLNDKETLSKMKFGTDMHYYLEVLDFDNPDLSIIPEDYKDRINNFLNCDLLKDISNGKIYKEYEFIYNIDNNITHGIIDLLIEYSDHFDIIDYKLKNIDDENYDKQLNGYRNYIESISNKKVNCYLYSIIDENYREVVK